MTQNPITQILTPEVLEKYQGLIFDMDGTLLETVSAHGLAWEQTGKLYNKEFDVSIMHRLTGSSAKIIAAAMVEDAGLDPSLTEEVLQTKINIVDKLLYDAAKELPAFALARAYKGKKAMGIGTGSYRKFIDLLDRKFGLYQMFGREHIFGMEDVSKHKPDSETWLKVAASLNLKPEQALVFEDGTFGIQGALACGMDAFDVVNNKLYFAKDYKNLDEIKAALAQRKISS
ncbi:HAD-IA family hydrolase [Psittacicella gerlachiana]|uniref:HAD superfamily hydrolase (TIGR01509 family) n=1 Tax=Psittacicella gerlachiana TaxID=2028574 RepID=A0A3A1YDI0_9GAMM|nr:HAD-IA family hydrolase [Psittacicella gerlachiana]RIY36222.1 hypothetical protein CKF59_02855 [Psittacicella gerlachiana]